MLKENWNSLLKINRGKYKIGGSQKTRRDRS
jgi:hypothetical protein